MMKTKKIFPFGDTIINEVNKENWDDCTRVPEKPDFTWKELNNLLEAERNKAKADVLKEVCDFIESSDFPYFDLEVIDWDNWKIILKQLISSLQSPQRIKVNPSSATKSDSAVATDYVTNPISCITSANDTKTGDTNSKKKCYCSENVFCNYCWKEQQQEGKK